jgi:dihydroxyacetone kinase
MFDIVVNSNQGGPSLDDPSEGAGWAAPIRKETWEAKSDRTRDNLAKSSEA